MRKIFAIGVVFIIFSVLVFASSDDGSTLAGFSTTDQITDTELVLEGWMLAPGFDNTGLEKRLDLEEWMIDQDGFSEGNIELEKWMLNDSYYSGTEEQDLELEHWMFIFS